MDLLIMILTTKKKKLAKYHIILPPVRTASTSNIIAKNTMITKKEYNQALVKSLKSLDNKKQKQKIASHIKKPGAYNKNHYKIKSGDSISSIAMNMIQDYHQFETWDLLMEKLIETNDDVFLNSNYNHLKVGSILTLPDLYIQKQEKKHLALPTIGDKSSRLNIINASKLNGNSKKQIDASIAISKKTKSNKEAKTTIKGKKHITSMERWKKHKDNLVISQSHINQHFKYNTIKAMSIQNIRATLYHQQGVYNSSILDL